MSHEFKHPKYYTELRKRNKALRSCDAYSKENSNYTERQQSGQAISYDDSTESQGVRPGQGHKQRRLTKKEERIGWITRGHDE